MSVAAVQRKAADTLIPLVTCPMCGKQMRLALVEPQDAEHDHLHFDCECGFDYQMSDAARKDKRR